MLSIQIREVADYPPENVVETSAKPCCCCCCCCNTTANASDRDDPLEIHSSLELADFAEINRVIEDQGVEDEHGYKGRKPPKMADNVNYIHFHERMIRIRSEYDMYADFLGTHAYSRAPWTSASQVVRAKSKVDAVARRLDEQMTRLDMEVAKFSYSVSHNTWFDWYSGVDDMTGECCSDSFPKSRPLTSSLESIFGRRHVRSVRSRVDDGDVQYPSPSLRHPPSRYIAGYHQQHSATGRETMPGVHSKASDPAERDSFDKSVQRCHALCHIIEDETAASTKQPMVLRRSLEPAESAFLLRLEFDSSRPRRARCQILGLCSRVA